ncbi:GNAT family N-acetyltransferase [Marivirga tractuosa]|uniref:GNAT family N-acetyltransferase n=1 Tax=Marivirga tractuosa TaxID=1006 RepID=UPI0035D0E3AB
MNSYKVLSQQKFESDGYAIAPIRMEDRYAIMQWRNEQIYHLRQDRPLTKEGQDNYFNEVIAKLFDQEQPGQILFSYLKDGQCIGYGGLVHINWTDKNAEISFVMETSLEKEHFEFHWSTYLALIEEVAFKELGLHKIYTYAFDLRPRLYTALSERDFKKEAVLKGHARFNNEFIDVLIHSKFQKNMELSYSLATNKEVELLFEWVNDKEVRQNSFNSDDISWEGHKKWFEKKLKDKNCKIFIFYEQDTPVGQMRLDKINSEWFIDYSISKEYRGRGYGTKMVNAIKDSVNESPLVAEVKSDNKASAKTFEKCGFKLIDTYKQNNELVFQYKYEKL